MACPNCGGCGCNCDGASGAAGAAGAVGPAGIPGTPGVVDPTDFSTPLGPLPPVVDGAEVEPPVQLGFIEQTALKLGISPDILWAIIIAIVLFVVLRNS